MGYRVRYVGREVPARDFDGWAAGLRLLQDGQYVQFFRAIAAAPDLLPLEPKPSHDWWTEFIVAAASQIEQLVSAGGFTPGPPGEPMYLRPDVAAVHQASRRPDPGRRHLTANEPSIEGIDVLRFGEGEEFDERRRAPR
jgi:hypothetical protein